MMEYPETCIRGIPNDSYLEDGLPSNRLFSEFKVNPDRDDDFMEISINWNDNEEALQKIFEQKKKDSDDLQFKAGGAIIDRKGLDKLKSNIQIKGLWNYERRELPENKFHGNLLMKPGISSSKKNMIVSAMALCVTRVEVRK